MSLAALPLADFMAGIRAWNDRDRDDALYARCRTDLALFCAVCFPERFTSPFNAMHRAMLARPKVAWDSRGGEQRIADAAPRGGAKSTIASYADLVHDVVYGLELFIPILSTTYGLAEGLVQDLHATFSTPETAPALHRLYGPFRVSGGATNFVVRVPGGDGRGVRIASFSFGGSIRGEKHAGVRPTKIVLDDCDHRERVRSPLQRAKTWDFLTKDVLKAGHQGGRVTIFRMLGTVLHPDSMLSNVLTAPGWTATKWRAVLSWPDRMDLWQDCRRLWADLTDPDRVDSARRFYARHKADMDAGAEVLWPEAESLWDLMVLRWSDGAASFNSEKQNEPVDPERQVFDVDALRRCRFDGEVITTSAGRALRLNTCTLAVWLDPRASDEIERNDYAAIALVARDSVGYRYVLRCSLKRDSPAGQRARYWSFFDQLGPQCRYGYEDNGFAALNDEGFARDRDDRQKAGKVWKLSPKGHTSTESKHDRIVALQPDCENGWIEWAEDLPPIVLEQLREIPAGTHDDGPDAIERALWLVSDGAMPEAKLSPL